MTLRHLPGIPALFAPAVLISVAALFTGLAAGGALFASTVYSSDGQWGPGAMAALQAFGVFIGSFLSLPFCTSKKLPAVTGTLGLCAAIACVLLAAAPLHSLTVVAIGLVGLAVGLAVATTDALAAQLDKPGKAASTILKTALLAALGAAVAPLLVQGAVAGSASAYVVPAAGLVLASGSWFALASASVGPEEPVTRTLTWPALKPAMALAFLFGYADNGILSLAPSHFYRAGASGWTVAAIGVAAAAGAVVVQLAAVLHVERKVRPDRGTLFYVMALTGFCLVGVASGLQSPLLAALLLVALGILVDVIYGLGLIETLRFNHGGDLSRSATGYVCACALGEVVGPLASDLAGSQNMMSLLFLTPAALLAFAMFSFRPQPALGAKPC